MYKKWKNFINEATEGTVNVDVPKEDAEILIDLGEKLEDDHDQDEFKAMAISLTNFCNNHFKWSEPPSLFLKQDQENSLNPLGRTAHYDLNKKSISVYTTGRHTKDILRSLAHELVHHHQNERGDLGSCGDLGPGYAQNNKKLRNMEKEAYLKGNMLFRDWEDSCKSKSIKQLKESNNMKDKEIKISKKILKNIIDKFVANKLMEKKKVLPEETFLDEIGVTSDDVDMSGPEPASDGADSTVDPDALEEEDKADVDSLEEESTDPVKGESDLYESRFGGRNDKLFNKLSKLWTK